MSTVRAIPCSEPPHPRSRLGTETDLGEPESARKIRNLRDFWPTRVTTGRPGIAGSYGAVRADSDPRLKIVVSPVRVRVSPLANPHSCGIYCFSDRVGEAINGYSIGYLGPGVLRVRDRKPSADQRSGLVRDEVTTTSVVVGKYRAHIETGDQRGPLDPEQACESASAPPPTPRGLGEAVPLPRAPVSSLRGHPPRGHRPAPGPHRPGRTVSLVRAERHPSRRRSGYRGRCTRGSCRRAPPSESEQPRCVQTSLSA